VLNGKKAAITTVNRLRVASNSTTVAAVHVMKFIRLLPSRLGARSPMGATPIAKMTTSTTMGIIETQKSSIELATARGCRRRFNRALK